MGSDVCEAAIKAGGQVSEARLWDMLMQFAAIGARDDGGVERHALSKQDIAARALLIEMAREHGFAVSVDGAANLWIRRQGTEPDSPPVITGSHMDSQPAGGKFDGILGVAAGLEALIAMNEAGVATKRPVDVVAWTNEEGGRFERGCTGSSVWSGELPISAFLDDIGHDGIKFADALSDTLAATPDLPHRDDQWPAHAFLELHIEQGPVLEQAGILIAAVTSIQGTAWMNVEVFGTAGHAGTTPNAVRRDAFQAAHRAIGQLNELMHDPDDRVRFTVGRMIIEPNSPNTVPEKVLFTIDFRHPDEAVLENKKAQFEPLIAAAVAPCDYKITPTQGMAPVRFPDHIVEVVERSADALGLASMRLASGAFHDALHAARVCPSGMIFIPCRDGLSHHPDEWAEPAHCAAGAKTLAATVVELANE